MEVTENQISQGEALWNDTNISLVVLNASKDGGESYPLLPSCFCVLLLLSAGWV